MTALSATMNFDQYTIRPLNEHDTDAFFNLIEKNRANIEDYFSGTVAKNKTLAATTQYIPEMMTRAENKIHFVFLVVNTINNALIGYIDIKSIDWNIPKGELGYFIDQDYCKKGIGTKMMRIIVQYCFDQLHFKKLFVRTHAENFSSRKIVEKNGFRIEGVLRKDYKTTKGEIVDLLYYGLIKDDFYC